MKIVFVAGPYRGDGSASAIKKNIARSQVFQRALAEAGIAAYSPNIHDAHWDKLDTVEARKSLKKVSPFILKEIASALVVMPGWESSKGTLEEIAIAKKRNIPIFFPKDATDLVAIKKWNNQK